MGLVPREWYGYTLTEWLDAIEGYSDDLRDRLGLGPEESTAPLTRSELEDLMERYPDAETT